ncbi:MAG TPA: hypothetical protein ENJ09_16160 [Planctomycetes bacterium]|nr:hypothetical protein [Planctomycetota bacterium]
MPLASLLPLALLALVPIATIPRDEKDEKRANELFAKAEFALEKERYEDAVKTFRLIATKYPDTPAGREAKRRARPTTFLGAKWIVEAGPPDNRVDVALMGDGYTLGHQKGFNKVADDVPAIFERQRTFREYFSYFNFLRYNLVSKDDNVDGFGREEDTALDGHVMGTVQGHVAVDPEAVKRALANVPENDGLAIVFVRAGSLGTGSPGIATIGGRDASTIIHEWGHAFGGLGDEYATYTHERGELRSSPNVSAESDPEKVPWAPWIRARAKGVGVYEGAAGRERGAYKPTASGCVMLNGEFFCPPCREALLLAIYRLVDPIEWESSPPHPLDHTVSLELTDSLEFEVHVMRPRSHTIDTRWWVLPEGEAPRDPTGYDQRYAIQGRFSGDRRERGALRPIDAKPAQEIKHRKNGKHTFRLRASDLEPGRYRVICRARDSTKLPGEKLPWVLTDPYGLLESERAWWVTVPER